MKSRQTQEQLIVFTRYPEPGTTKTRLAKSLGDQGAADTQRKLAGHTLVQIRQFMRHNSAAIVIYYDGGCLEKMQQWLGNDFSYRRQSDTNLGQRLKEALAAAFSGGVERVVIIGTDCPGLRTVHLNHAFAALHHSNIVLGPATDGGYYLIGLNRCEKSLFRNIPWGTGTVLQTTLLRAAQKGLSVKLLETLSDVDRPEDLVHLHLAADSPGQSPAAGMALPDAEPMPPSSPSGPVTATGASGDNVSCSIIIPTLNEAENLARLLPDLLAEPGVEVVVADGGSTDETLSIAKSFGARILRVAGGRARQLNGGARMARADILLFLHADTKLAPGFAPEVRQALSQPGVVAGAFRLVIDGKGFGFRVIEWLANLRSRILQMPYGDQGIFVSTPVFAAVGGYPDLAIMEDYELMRRLKNLGRIRILPLTATTSPRRWQKLGIVRTTAINQAIIFGYLLGIKPHKLSQWYNKGR